MKFCLSSRQSPEYLKQADEIKVQYRDMNQIYDLMDKYTFSQVLKYEKNALESLSLV